MERLTIETYDVIGSYVPKEMCSIGRDGFVDDCDSCAEYCENVDNKCENCAIQECFNRLAKYEDTGLTPEQVLEMDKMYQKLAGEVMAYRKVGTVVEVKSMGKYSRLAKHGTTGQAIDECAEYEAIGTVEECREAVERQKAKKPDVWGDGYDDEGNMIYDMYSCPNCGRNYEIDYEKYDFCPHCGQAIDWSDSDV